VCSQLLRKPVAIAAVVVANLLGSECHTGHKAAAENVFMHYSLTTIA
jgi:hypothetical protein